MPQAAHDNTTPTTADRTPSFADRMIDLSTGIDLLIERLNHAFDIVSDLGHSPGQDGWYAMNAITETRWVTERLSKDIRTVRRAFDQDPSNHRKVRFAQAAE